tara:strand:- start:15649 stop:17583 length:1935 start_codon:yes stop_codon:yes gene_type:complete
MFANSPFVTNQGPDITIADSDIIFVSDMFAEEYSGGAEMTTHALIDSSPFKVQKIKSSDLTMALLEEGVEKYWIFGNFSLMSPELIPSIIGNLDYSVLEYDYKYCKWRSPEKHKEAEGEECSCENDVQGKMVSAFLYGAKSLWWMSEKQMDHYHELFPFLNERENVILSSVFDESFFMSVKVLKEKYENAVRKGWVVLGSNSWVKGFENAKEWCENNGKEYDIVWGWKYEDVLNRLATAEGLVYLPRGGDTCPRLVIEAKMLGCKLELNDNVQHKDEIWFNTDDEFDTEAYLYAARERFWNSIKHSMNWYPTISGYTTLLNAEEQMYPWRESIISMLGFCDEVIVVDGGSSDSTWSELQTMAAGNEKIRAVQNVRDWDNPRFAVYDGEQKAYARSLCTGNFCWQQDADEIVHENDYKKIRDLIKSFPGVVDLVSLPVVEYWGGEEKVRIDVNPWKWRLSKNSQFITHGIPGSLRKFDDNGSLYAMPGTDGCDYIHNENYDIIAHANFYNSEAHNLRAHALMKNEDALKMYQEWFSRNIELLPSVHHYSWFDLGRKIRTYRDYWSKHWQSLYDIEQDDTPENNMFFEKSWSSVKEEEIDALALELKEKMGGWVFHEKVDFDKPTPHIELACNHPEVMNEWLSRQD